MPFLKDLINTLPPPSTPVLAATGLTLTALSLPALYYKSSNNTKRALKVKLRNVYRSHYLHENPIVPISVNFHFSRKCNAECGFCFHTETSSYVAPLEDAQKAMKLLADEGMQKINFAGGEPFLYHKHLGQLCQYAKEELGLPSVSIVSNGTKVTENWLRTYGQYVDILAISCDSFVAERNALIGRKDRKSGKAFDNVAQLFQIRDWCKELGIKFKLNTVVCSLNWDEDMVEMVKRLAPFRWKCFQVLVVKGENESDERKRNAWKFVVGDEQFEAFCERHRGVVGFTPEANGVMRSSYLILDEYLKFLDKGEGEEKQTECVLEVGVQKALSQVKWDQAGFNARGGLYDWSKKEPASCGGALKGIDPTDLDW